MIKEIKYKGYAENPSDYECSDGELAMSLNAIYEDGALRPVLSPETILTLDPSKRVVCVHETSVYTHYIVTDDENNLYYIDGNVTSDSLYTFSGPIYQVTPVGNTLVVLTSEGMYYFLWKESAYINLGNELPSLKASPYIYTEILNATNIKDKYKIDFTAEDLYGTEIDFTDKDKIFDEEPPLIIELSDADKAGIYETGFAVLNKCSNALREKGYFLEPFYVRFAYRMYDGSHIGHTVPVLLVPTTWGKPIMALVKNNNKIYFNPVYSCSSLFYGIENNDIPNDWADLITHIDVFVTEPLIDYTDSSDTLMRVIKYNPFYYTINIGQYREYVTAEAMVGKEWKSIDDIIHEMYSDDNTITETSRGQFQFMKSGGYLTGYEYKIRINLNSYSDSEYLLFKSKYPLWAETSFEQILPEENDLINERYPDWTVYSIKRMRPAEDVVFHLNADANADDIEYVDYCRVSLNLKAINLHYYIESRRVDELEYNEVLTSCTSFYKIDEIKLEDISNKIMFDRQFVLQNLVARETLDDIGTGVNKAISSNSFNYNNRLNVVVDKLKFTDANTSLKKQNPCVIQKDSTSDLIVKKAYVEIYENNKYAYVEIPTENIDYGELVIFSYPNNGAKTLVALIVREYNNGFSPEYYQYKFKMVQHDFLNMSFVFTKFANLFGDSSTNIVHEIIRLSGEGDFYIPSCDAIEYGNVVRLSDVNNPFRFSEEYTVSLPVSKIYALSTAAKALSQGQFGQYPLYAFTSDGIWALELTATGTYSARQPISRDVVINKDSITQIDTAVLFATDRGIMLISGSQVICISDMISAEDMFQIKDLPKINEFTSLYASSCGAKVSADDLSYIPFTDFVRSCRMIYDYPHQHIIIYNPDKKYAYVYSLLSQLWGMILCNIQDNVNSYPEALAMTSDNRLVDFSQSTTGVPTILVVTRPFKLDAPDVHKTISTVIQRGNLKDKYLSQVLYGSNDLNNWMLVWSSDNMYMRGFSGTPYKYYRLALMRRMLRTESLDGASVQYEPKLMNKLR